MHSNRQSTHGQFEVGLLVCRHDMTNKTQLRAIRSNHPKTILVPIDFSAASTKALSQAEALAGDSSRIILLHVVTPTAQNNAELAALIETAKRKLSAFANGNSTLAPESIRSQARSGTPFREILQCAKEKNAEMIVLAVDGSDSLGGIALGHTVDRVSRYAPCPVLLVREHDAKSGATAAALRANVPVG